MASPPRARCLARTGCIRIVVLSLRILHVGCICLYVTIHLYSSLSISLPLSQLRRLRHLTTRYPSLRRCRSVHAGYRPQFTVILYTCVRVPVPVCVHVTYMYSWYLVSRLVHSVVHLYVCMPSQNYKVEREIEAKFLNFEGKGLPYRMQCYRSTGSFFDDPADENERLRTYFLQQPEYAVPPEDVRALRSLSSSFFQLHCVRLFCPFHGCQMSPQHQKGRRLAMSVVRLTGSL